MSHESTHFLLGCPLSPGRGWPSTPFAVCSFLCCVCCALPLLLVLCSCCAALLQLARLLRGLHCSADPGVLGCPCQLQAALVLLS